MKVIFDGKTCRSCPFYRHELGMGVYVELCGINSLEIEGVDLIDREIIPLTHPDRRPSNCPFSQGEHIEVQNKDNTNEAIHISNPSNTTLP